MVRLWSALSNPNGQSRRPHNRYVLSILSLLTALGIIHLLAESD